MDDYLASISHNMRHELRGKLRFLRKQGDVRLRYYGPDEIQAALVSLETMLEFNRRRFPLTWRAQGYYANLVRQCLPARTLLMSELVVDGQPLSWTLDFFYHGRMYKYACAFDPGFPKWSVGNLHTYLSLEESTLGEQHRASLSSRVDGEWMVVFRAGSVGAASPKAPRPP
ncbi:MAG: hypothetical protein AUG06_00180 [Actinobacteria bacterium 13_1_20CM_2_65_11]|nr:MAG: hypothetical protein AUG06_00180 [Actinobacteria bacterium 13_1_20CM_2_65_11]